MKVILVNICAPIDSECPLRLIEGNIYNVSKCCNYYGIEWYELSECLEWLHQANGFIPLSDIDERELVNEDIKVEVL